MTHRVGLEELGGLLPGRAEVREHRGRRCVVRLALAHERVVLEQVLALRCKPRASVLPTICVGICAPSSTSAPWSELRICFAVPLQTN